LGVERDRLRLRAEAERETTERKIRRELERKQAARERALNRTVERLQEQNSELQRRADRLTASDRGDDNEVDVFKRLTQAFPTDDIKRQGKAGDILETVRSPENGNGERAGLILYECKDTLRWSNGYVAQIKADGATHRTPYLVLVSRALPRGVKDVCIRDGVVIVDRDHALQLAAVMRRLVLEVHRVELAGHRARDKAALVYEYLASTDFRQALAEVISASSKLTVMLRKEKRDHERSWTRREQAYGELQRKAIGIDETIRGLLETEPAPALDGRRRREVPSTGRVHTRAVARTRI
jgi:hypothetical protein